MYRYDALDQRLVDERVAQFRHQVERRLAGSLSDDEFKPLRLMNGLYLQLHAYMLRVAIPYGILSAAQLRVLAAVARRYDKGYGHFTTRQNLQYNWIRLEDTPEILAELARVGLHAIQTSGNCIRNVTTDHLAGVAADEIEDPRVWCEIIRQWSTLHPEFSFLPRKFKIAVTGSPADRAATRVHDLALRMVRDESGAAGFEVIVGGGQGRTPMLGATIRAFLPRQHLLSYLEAVLRVYNLYGRRDNLFKARIKILVAALGVEAFTREVETEWEQLRDGPLALPEAEQERIAACFRRDYGPSEDPAGDQAGLAAERRLTPAFDRWVETNVFSHQVAGYAAAMVSLKPPGGVPGDATAEQMEGLAALVERFSRGELRVSHSQNLALPHVKVADLAALWRGLDELALASANIDRAGDIIACPGLDYCSLANARSIPVAQALSERFARPGRSEVIGPLAIKISGCINACGHHHIGAIGILGVDKRGEEFYQITLGGSAGTGAAGTAALGTLVGPSVPALAVPDTVDAILDVYLARRQEGECFLDTWRRVGLEPFRSRLYAERGNAEKGNAEKGNEGHGEAGHDAA